LHRAGPPLRLARRWGKPCRRWAACLADELPVRERAGNVALGARRSPPAQRNARRHLTGSSTRA